MGIAEEVLVFLDVKGMPKLKDFQKAMTRLGYNLRLGGRDMMRMGGSLRRLSNFMMGFANAVFKTSDIFQDAMGDVMYALEDVMEASGFLDLVINALEWLADLIERFPIIGLAMGFLFIAGIFVLFISKIFMVVGFLKLLVGTFLSARSHGLGLGETVKLLISVMTGHTEALRKNVALEAESLWLSKQRQKQLTLEAFAEKDLTKAKKSKQKADKKEKKTMFGALGGALKLISAFAVMSILFFALGPILEALAPIFEAIGDAFEEVFDALEETGVIDWIAEWIRSNKELVVASLIAIAILPFLVSGIKALGGIIGKLTGKLGSLGETMGEVTKTTDQTEGGMWKTILAVAALLAALVPVIYALGEFLKIAADTGLTVAEVGAIITLLVANLGLIMGVLLAVVKVLQGVQNISWNVIAAFLAMIPVVISLIAAFAWFLSIAAETGFTAEGIAAILLALSGSVSILITVITAATSFLASLNQVNLQAIAYVITLAGVMISLILAFGQFLQIASETGFRVDEINTLLLGLTAGIIALVAALVIAVVVLASLSVTAAMAMPVVALLLGIGTAALMVGAGFFLAGLGVKMAAEGILLLANNILQVLVLIPTVFILIGAIGALSISLIALGGAGFVAMAGMMALATGIFAVTTALLAMVIPLGIIRALGGQGAVIAAIEKIPTLQEGGVITAPGLAVLHEEEAVVPAAEAAPLRGRPSRYQPKEPPLTISVDVTGARSMEEIIQRAVEASVSQISERQAKKYRRSEY